MRIGLERLTSETCQAWGRIGLLANQASVDNQLNHALDRLRDLVGSRLTALFCPQHGFWGDVQDNMIETQHTMHPRFGIPIYSLYSETRAPNREMLDKIDTLVFDLQHVGCRVYTFKATLLACLQQAKEHSKRLVVLDRPNPLGGLKVEGRVLDPDMISFVGPKPFPLRHALTLGELARWFNDSIGAELEVVTVQDWDVSSSCRDWERQWVATSPNLSSTEPVLAYPATVWLEGTNASEGRGSTLPFAFVGAPYVSSEALITRVKELLPGELLHGVALRELAFLPTFQKWQGQLCYGFQLHLTDFDAYWAVPVAGALITALRELGGDQFGWKNPPYEYEYDRLPIDLLVGARGCERYFESFDANDAFWTQGISDFVTDVKPFLLYERDLQTL